MQGGFLNSQAGTTIDASEIDLWLCGTQVAHQILSVCTSTVRGPWQKAQAGLLAYVQNSISSGPCSFANTPHQQKRHAGSLVPKFEEWQEPEDSRKVGSFIT